MKSILNEITNYKGFVFKKIEKAMISMENRKIYT